MENEDGYYNGKWRTGTFIDYATALESADDWLEERIFARLQNEANISFEEYQELCEIGRPQK